MVKVACHKFQTCRSLWKARGTIKFLHWPQHAISRSGRVNCSRHLRHLLPTDRRPAPVYYLKVRGTHFGVVVSVSSVANFRNLGEETKGRTGLLVSFGKDVPKSPYLNNRLQHAPSLYFPQIWLSPSDRQPTYFTNLKRKTWFGLTSLRPFFLY